MEISYADDSLRRTCLDRIDLPIALPDVALADLRTALIEMRAASQISELPTIEVEHLSVDNVPDAVSIILRCDFRLVLKSAHTPETTPRLPDGSTDWMNVYRIQVYKIESLDA